MSGANYLSLSIGPLLPAIRGGHEAWRYTILWGILPAIPLLLVRPFLPESPIWQKKREEGTLQRPSILELFHPEFRKTALLELLHDGAAPTPLPSACCSILRALFPALRGFVNSGARGPAENRDPALQGYQEVGSLLGRIVMAVLAIFILSRRRLLRIFQIPGLILIPLVVLLPAIRDTAMSRWGIFLLGMVSVAQFSFWGNYLPTLYPTHLRGTGESFAANVGGRMLGTSAALMTTTLVAYMPGGSASRQLGYAAGMVGFLAYAAGFIGSFWLDEPARSESRNEAPARASATSFETKAVLILACDRILATFEACATSSRQFQTQQACVHFLRKSCSDPRQTSPRLRHNESSRGYIPGPFSGSNGESDANSTLSTPKNSNPQRSAGSEPNVAVSA